MSPECDWNPYCPSAASEPSKDTDPDAVLNLHAPGRHSVQHHRAAEGFHLQPRRPDPGDVQATAGRPDDQSVVAAHVGKFQIAGKRPDLDQPRQRSETPVAAGDLDARLAVHSFDRHVAGERLDGDAGSAGNGHQIVHRHERYPLATAEQGWPATAQKGTPVPRVVGSRPRLGCRVPRVSILHAAQRVGGGGPAAGAPLDGPNRQVVAVHPGHGNVAADVGEHEAAAGVPCGWCEPTPRSGPRPRRRPCRAVTRTTPTICACCLVMFVSSASAGPSGRSSPYRRDREIRSSLLTYSAARKASAGVDPERTGGGHTDGDERHQREAGRHPRQRDQVHAAGAGELRLEQRRGRRFPVRLPRRRRPSRASRSSPPATSRTICSARAPSATRRPDLRGTLRHDVAQGPEEPDARQQQPDGSHEAAHTCRNPRRQQCRADRFRHRRHRDDGHAGVYSGNGAPRRSGRYAADVKRGLRGRTRPRWTRTSTGMAASRNETKWASVDNSDHGGPLERRQNPSPVAVGPMACLPVCRPRSDRTRSAARTPD